MPPILDQQSAISDNRTLIIDRQLSIYFVGYSGSITWTYTCDGSIILVSYCHGKGARRRMIYNGYLLRGFASRQLTTTTNDQHATSSMIPGMSYRVGYVIKLGRYATQAQKRSPLRATMPVVTTSPALSLPWPISERTRGLSGCAPPPAP